MRTVDIGDFTVGEGYPPRIMGVLNMSLESNWDPSVRGTVTEAAAFAEELFEQGADIVDVGLQSSNPKNEWLPPEVEFDRLPAALEVIDAVDREDAVFSIETRYAEVAAEALDGGFDVVNDVCGFADPEMPEVCAARDAPVVKMASPPDLKKPGHLKTVDDVFEALCRGGFTDKTIIDPAFGGWYDEKTYEDNWEAFRRLREFRAFGRPILTATNREDFLGTIAGKMDHEEQLNVSLAAATLEVDRGASIVRTHDVPETADVVKVAHHMKPETATGDSPRVVELRGVDERELERYQTLSEATVGDPARTATLCFQVGGLSDTLRSQVLESAEDAGVFGIEEGDRIVLAGSINDFRGLLVALPEGPAPIRELAGRLRLSVART
ncbi:MAG: dihydropteroate synthase [Salinigranum sp.]